MLKSSSAEQKNMAVFVKPMEGKHRNKVSCTSDRHSYTVSQNYIHSPAPVDIRCWNPFVLLELLPEFKTLNNSEPHSLQVSEQHPMSTTQTSSGDQIWTMCPSTGPSFVSHPGKVTPLKIVHIKGHAHKGKEVKHKGMQKTRFFKADKQNATKFPKHGSRNVVIDKGNVCISERCEIQPTSRSLSSVLISGQKHANSQEDILLDGDCLARDYASRDKSKKRKENCLQELCSPCVKKFARLCNHKFPKRPWMKYQGMFGQTQSQGQKIVSQSPSHFEPDCCKHANKKSWLPSLRSSKTIRAHEHKETENTQKLSSRVMKGGIASLKGNTTFLGKGRHCRNETATYLELVAKQGSHFGSLLLEGEPQKCVASQRAALMGYRHQMRAQSKSFALHSQPAPACEKRKWKSCKYCQHVINADSEQQKVHNQRRHPFNCSLCRWQFASKEELMCHRKECEDLKYTKCEMCNCRYFKSQQAHHCHSQKHRVILQAMRKGAVLSQSTGTFDQYLMKALCPQGRQCQVCNSFLMPRPSVQETRPASSCFKTEDRLVSATSESKHFSPAAQQQLVESDLFLILNDPILSQDCQEQVGVVSDTVNSGMSTIVPKYNEGELSLLGLLEDGQLSLPPLLQESSISTCSSPAVVNNIHTVSDEVDDLVLSLFAAARDSEFSIDDSLDMLAETEHTQTSPNSSSRLSHHTTQFPTDNTSSGSVTCVDKLSLPTSDLSSVDALVSSYANIRSVFDHREDSLLTLPCSSEDGCIEMLSDAMNLTSPDSTDSGFDQLSLLSPTDPFI